MVLGHTATNLIVNVKEALQGFPIGGMFCWLDSSVAKVSTGEFEERRAVRRSLGTAEPTRKRRQFIGMPMANPGRLSHLLAESHPFTEKMVADAHIRTLHGGVSLTMAKMCFKA